MKSFKVTSYLFKFFLEIPLSTSTIIMLFIATKSLSMTSTIICFIFASPGPVITNPYRTIHKNHPCPLRLKSSSKVMSISTFPACFMASSLRFFLINSLRASSITSFLCFFLRSLWASSKSSFCKLMVILINTSKIHHKHTPHYNTSDFLTHLFSQNKP